MSVVTQNGNSNGAKFREIGKIRFLILQILKIDEPTVTVAVKFFLSVRLMKLA